MAPNAIVSTDFVRMVSSSPSGPPMTKLRVLLPASRSRARVSAKVALVSDFPRSSREIRIDSPSFAMISRDSSAFRSCDLDARLSEISMLVNPLNPRALPLAAARDK